MGGKSDPPPPPDYSGIAAASEKSAQLSYDMAQKQLDWAKQQFGENQQVSDAVIQAALDRQETSDKQAAADRQRYETIFQPLEDQLAQQAQDYSTPERQEQAAGAAEADVSNQFEAARNTAQQRLEQFGVDPSQTRQSALDLQSRLAQAAASASAGNQARQNIEDRGMALRSEAINVGRGYPGQIAGEYGTAMNSGNQGVNTGLATTASGANTMGTGTQWQGLGNQGLGVWGNTLNMGYQNQLAGWQAEQQNSTGFGDILGMVAGIGTSKLMGKYGFAEGGGVPEQALNMAPPDMHGGVAVTPQMSPSGGAQPDDVPAQLQPGEFVIPKEAVSWFGEKHLQGLIQKAVKEKANAQAQPQPAPATGGPPQIRTSALPAMGG